MTDPEYRDIWKYFEERSVKLKERSLTVSTWCLAFATSILGFGAEKLIKIENGILSVETPEVVAILSFIGFGIAWYTRKIVMEYGLHIERNFKRADEALKQQGTLVDIWNAGKLVNPDNLKLPEPLRFVETVTYVFNICFTILSLVSLVLLFL